MIRIWHVWLASLLALATSATGLAQESIPWITDLAQARRVAEQQQKLVLLHFYGDGCQPCQQLENHVFNQPELIRLLSTHFVCVKVHVQQQQNIANYYKISQIPTDIVVLPTGAQLFRTTSPANVNSYIAMLDQVRANALTNGFQQVDRMARNVAQQLAPSLSGLPPRPDEQPTSQPVNSENAFQVPLPPSRYSGTGTTSGQTNAPQSAVISNDFVGPLDHTPAGHSEPPPNRPTTGSRYGNPYLNDSVAAAAPSQTQSDGNAPNQAATNSPNVAPTQQPATPAAPGNGQAGAAHAGSTAALTHDNSQAGTRPGSATPPALGNQSWTPALQPNTPFAVAQQPAEVVPGGGLRAKPANQNLPQLPPGNPPLALDGHCPVTLLNLGKWEKGDPRFGMIHRGRTYLFKSQIELERFGAPGAADRFAPVLSGLDPVRFAETGQAVDGRREHGVLFDGQIFLFADEEALVRFEQQPHRYVAVVRQAMANGRNMAPQR